MKISSALGKRFTVAGSIFVYCATLSRAVLLPLVTLAPASTSLVVEARLDHHGSRTTNPLSRS